MPFNVESIKNFFNLMDISIISYTDYIFKRKLGLHKNMYNI